MEQLKGIVSSMVTSFDDMGKVDNEALIRNINFQKNAGIKSICILGGTGEATSLTQKERFEIMEATMEHALGLNVVIGALAGTPWEIKEEIKKAKQLGARACMVMAPPFVRPSEQDVERYMIDLAKLNQPLMIFNTPSRSGFAMSTELIIRLSKVKNIVAIKESSGDLIKLQNIVQNTNETFSVLTGGDINYLPSMVFGADGGLLASAALFPELLLALEKAIFENKLQLARELHYVVKLISDIIYEKSHPVPLKYAMKLRGLPVGKAREPFEDIDNSHKKRIQQVMNYVKNTLQDKVDFDVKYAL